MFASRIESPLRPLKTAGEFTCARRPNHYAREVKGVLAKFLLFTACVHLMGGHWLALQGVAWVSMLANHSRGETLAAAVSKTFDGRHPCPLCKAVATGQSEEREQKEVPTDPSVKLVGVLSVESASPVLRYRALRYFFREPRARSMAGRPPSPPPRVV